MDYMITDRNLMLVETNRPIETVARCFGKKRAERIQRRCVRKMRLSDVEWHPYHLRVRSIGWGRYEVVAFQNLLVPVDELQPCECPQPCPRHD